MKNYFFLSKRHPLATIYRCHAIKFSCLEMFFGHFRNISLKIYYQDELDVMSKLNEACLRSVLSYHFLKYFSCKKTVLASGFFHSGLFVTTLMDLFCQSSKVWPSTSDNHLSTDKLDPKRKQIVLNNLLNNFMNQID